MPAVVRSRSWLCTLNNHEDEYEQLQDRLRDLGDRLLYACGQGERGEQGTPHLQFMVEFRNARALHTLVGAGKLLEHCHVESRRGSVLQAIEYCQKDDTYAVDVCERWEIGDRDSVIGLGQGRGMLPSTALIVIPVPHLN